jgi:nicotinamidase-related amidase
MLLKLQKSCLLIIDVQEKLTPLVLNHEKLVQNCQWLMRLAHELEVPIQVTEQYPKGLSKTVPSLRNESVSAIYSEKVFFSCASEPNCLETLNHIGREEIVIAGIETHVCVMQTAIELQTMGKNVFVVVDAASSRHEMDHRYGLKRMKAAGVTLVTKEMVFFEWIRCAGTPRFKELSQCFLKEDKK